MIALVLISAHFVRSMVRSFLDPAIRPVLIFALILLIIGTTFYHNVEGWGWLDAFYFCVITLATVGFGDFAPTTGISKVFTICYVIVGIGILLSVVDAAVKRTAERTGRRARGRLARGGAIDERGADREPRC